MRAPRSQKGRLVRRERVCSLSFYALPLDVVRRQTPAAADAYALGLLIHTVFNPTQPPPATAHPPHPPPTAASRGSIPHSLFACYKRLLNPNPKARLTPKTFLELGMVQVAGESSGFFASNRLVKVCAGLDDFNLGSESEKASFLRCLVIRSRN